MKPDAILAVKLMQIWGEASTYGLAVSFTGNREFTLLYAMEGGCTAGKAFQQSDRGKASLST